MIALHVVVAAVGAALGVFYPFISVILASFGFSPGEIGLVFSLGAVGFTVAVPAWGHLADVRLGRARTLQLCATVAGLAVLGLLLASTPLVITALLLLFWVFECSWQPLADALTVNVTGGRGYARVRLFMSLGFALATIAAGFLYDVTGYAASFLLFALTAGIVVISAAFVPDAERADLAQHRSAVAATARDGATAAGSVAEPSGSAWSRRLGSTGVAFQTAPTLALVLLASVLLHVGILSGFTFLPLRIEALGGSPSDVALSAGLSALAEIPGMLVMGRVVRRIGLRSIFAASALLYAVCIASWMVIEIPLLIVGTRIITGVAFSGIVVSIVLTIAAILPRDLQATGQALYQTSAFGIASIIANTVGGILYGSIGHAAVFGLGAILAVLAAGIGWLGFPRRGTT